MLPRRDVVLTGFALTPGTRRGLDAACFLVEAGGDEAAGNTERQALLFGETQRPAVAGERDEVADATERPAEPEDGPRPPRRPPTLSHPRATGLTS